MTAEPAAVRLQPAQGALFLAYARRLVARGYVHNSLGNIALRTPWTGYERGVVYTKPAGLSLEEVTLDDLVVTDVETGRVLHGRGETSIGHRLNREILLRRPDVHAVVHVHHDETIAFFAGGGTLTVLSVEFPLVLGRPPHVLPAHVDVERDVAPVRDFIDTTNAVIMEHHGVTTLGRTLSEAYHRLNTLTAEIRRNVQARQVAALTGEPLRTLDAASVEWAYREADRVVYPVRAA